MCLETVIKDIAKKLLDQKLTENYDLALEQARAIVYNAMNGL